MKVFDTIDNDYWPYPLRHLREDNPIAPKHVDVARISKPWGDKSIMNLFTAMAPVKIVNQMLSQRDGIEKYINFFPWGISGVSMEPLVASWKSGSRTILFPDQKFLMEYSLVPRTIKSKQGDLIHWDDLERPCDNVVKSKTTSEYYGDLLNDGYITIARDYLQDYTTQRNLALIQVYYAMNTDNLVEKDIEILGDKRINKIKLCGRIIDIRLNFHSKERLTAQVWCVRCLYTPGPSPITEGRWEYGDLFWPGIEGPVTEKKLHLLGFSPTLFLDLPK